MIMLKIRLK